MDNACCAFTSPHFLATQAGMDVLQRGGSAIDAMIAAAAMIAVTYPHMNGLGGDSKTLGPLTQAATRQRQQLPNGMPSVRWSKFPLAVLLLR